MLDGEKNKSHIFEDDLRKMLVDKDETSLKLSMVADQNKQIKDAYEQKLNDQSVTFIQKMKKTKEKSNQKLEKIQEQFQQLLSSKLDEIE